MKSASTSWLLLIATLPTSSATLRMRLWRSIKALGCAALRDGAYLVTEHEQHAVALDELADQVNKEGGQAWVINIAARTEADAAAFEQLFDRSAEHAELVHALNLARKGIQTLPHAEVAKTLRRLKREREAIMRIDFFPNQASLVAEAAWADFEEAANAILSPDEPHPRDNAILRLDRRHYQGRLWATRRNLWVDRVASAWLIRRFIDQDARFLWLESPAQCPPDALGFDFDGAAFTHVGEKVSFEVLAASFRLEDDPGLKRLAALVHALDVGGARTPPEAIGFEAILAGARARLNDDNAVLAEIGTALDSLYTYFRKERT